MKLLVTLLAFINGGFMLLDGIFVLLKGKYIGPEKPGPWANLFYKLQVDVFKLGPLFIIYGIVWLIFIAGLWTQQSWAYTLGLAISILTLWYLPVGALLSIIVAVILFTSRAKLGI